MIHTDRLSSGWQFCDDYDAKSDRNYFLEGRFELHELIAIWENTFNVISVHIIATNGGEHAYVIYREVEGEGI